ncbi:313_t:CDS:2 [Racocetra fulgida]|uniref:313_t:CDS:1 n=1 Tax=Racocetra fulgida TaxID=60492 RepID=A0A9N9B486_9GLOM|nr:313_t:CDS:2 [Racocetra fulgida]
MNQLAQQIQEMKIGYNKLAALLTTQAEANNPRMRPQPECPQRECLTEREAPVLSERRSAQPSHTLRCEVEANYGNVDDDYDLEREVFAGERNNVNIQPRETRETYPLINDDDLMQYNDAAAPIRAPRRKRGLSVIDLLAPYNITDDILTKPSSATVGQILQYPNQHRNLAKALRRPLLTEETHYEKVDLEGFVGDENDMFDQLVYEEEVEGTEAYLSHVEELLTTPVESETKDLEEKISKMDVSKELNDEQQKEAKEMLKKEKDVFVQTVEELGYTNRTNHMIDTGDAVLLNKRHVELPRCSRVHKE